ncbi:CGNR zinc finger domain-containing protein [Pseudonocardia spinosispora]|uniref:CGNR zinc finger domain-containing protein n=1 Tax=Pseudonocardia spinosispora TaxID=103441 RepID=UPI00040EADD0|nr:CGNR zinc finger domain-containing protein [Pseudonocardia spinosispora]
MSTKDFRFDCGATWLNLLATSGQTFSARPIERIDTPERLADWLSRCELAPEHSPGPSDLELAVSVRETVRAVALPTATGTPVPAVAVRALAKLLSDLPADVRLAPGDALLRRPPVDTAEALGRIVRQAVSHLTGVERHDLLVCAEHDCQGIFIDPTGRRRWCPAPACASRGRVRALRARRQQAGAGAGE